MSKFRNEEKQIPEVPKIFNPPKTDNLLVDLKEAFDEDVSFPTQKTLCEAYLDEQQ